MLYTLVENLGFSLIDRRPGEEFGGSSQITAEGKDLLDRYEKFSEMVRQFVDEAFAKCWPRDDQDKYS